MTSSLLKKIIRPDILAMSLLMLLSCLLCLTDVSGAAEVEIDCYQFLTAQSDYLGTLDKDKSKAEAIQRILALGCYYTIKIEGIVGNETITGLENYCRDAKGEHPGITYVLTEEKIKKVVEPADSNPKSWKDTLENKEEQLKELYGVVYPNKQLLRRAIKGNTECFDAALITAMVEKARNENAFSKFKDKTINWTAEEDCGCVLEDLSGVVYGFYPFWLTGEEQTIDFSVLSRIGYYALSFDEYGDLDATLPWWAKKTNKKKVDFLTTARDYRTKVDIVVYQNDWTKWSHLTKDNLIKSIVRLMSVELTDFFSTLKPYISLGGRKTPTVADGVTLYFKGYPDDEASKYLFVELINELRTKLKEQRNHYYLNIMLHMDEINDGVYVYETLKHLIPKCGKEAPGYHDQNKVDYFLVFLTEPTTNSKKKLRRWIEDHFKGIERRTMLRKIIPVTTSPIHGDQQLKDDIIYFEDNFGGVGLWPLPMTGDAKAIINASLKANYGKDNGTEPVTWPCAYVCPHRWGVRSIWDGLLIGLAGLCLGYFGYCRMRYWAGCHPLKAWLILGALLFLLTIPLYVALLVCDPHRSFEITDPMTLLGLPVCLTAGWILWRLYQSTREQP